MKFDTTFPHPHESEKIAQALLNKDDFLQEILWSELLERRNLYRWTSGARLEAQEGSPGMFSNQIWYYINKRYGIGTGTMYAIHKKEVYRINYIELGNGYKLNCYSCDPIQYEKTETNVLLLEFLYQEKGFPLTNDGTLRLRKFIQYMNHAPRNPYNLMIMHPAGDEVSGISPIMMACDYRRTKHTSADLTKIYKRHLKIEPTTLVADNFDGVKTPYYRVGIYDPIDPITPRSECPFFQLLEDGKCPFEDN